MYGTETLPIKTSRVAASGEAVAQKGKALGMYVMQTTDAGSVILRDDGALGAILGTWDTMASAEGINIPFPGAIEFGTNLYVEISNVTSVVVYHD